MLRMFLEFGRGCPIPGAEGTGSSDHWAWVLGTELGSSEEQGGLSTVKTSLPLPGFLLFSIIIKI